MSLCHLVPPQDTKWYKFPLSGEDTKWHNVYHLGSFAMFVTMATTKMVLNPFFDTNKENNSLGEIILDNCGFHGNKTIESALITEFGNHGNKQNI